MPATATPAAEEESDVASATDSPSDAATDGADQSANQGSHCGADCDCNRYRDTVAYASAADGDADQHTVSHA